MKNAIIIKNISNQYTAYLNGEYIKVIPTGKTKKNNKLLVGDNVEILKKGNDLIVNKILARKNELLRPKVANVDQALIVMSAKDPNFSTTLIDRLIFIISYEDIKPIIIVTKMDLLNNEEKIKIKEKIKDYTESGYCVICNDDENYILKIKQCIKNKISVLTGQSGAGKSTLLNKLDSKLELQTQKTSKALGRGKHTTRHTELFNINDGWIADTPGFSSLDFSNIELIKLSQKILDFSNVSDDCKFNDCVHINEPNCGVKKAVAEGKISAIRYKHYVEIADFLRKEKK